MEWTFGITDCPPRRWKTHEPCWDDEQLTATSSHSFRELVAKLCETALTKRRDEQDAAIDDHLWNLKVCSLAQATERRLPLWMRQHDSDEDEDGEDADDDESKYCGRLLIAPRQYESEYREEIAVEGYQFISDEETLDPQLLPIGHVVHFTYDFGSTTDLYLKVLSVRRSTVGTLLRYLEGSSKAGDVSDLKAVPAFCLPVEQQIDAYYPNFAKAFLGNYVPLQQRVGDDEEVQLSFRRGRSIGSATLGLSSCVRSDQDTTFCTMENADCSSDLLFAPRPFADFQEFLDIAEQAWTPRDPKKDKDHLERYDYSMVSRLVFPAGPEAEEAYQGYLEMCSEWFAQFGPKQLFFCRQAGEENQKQSDFDFAKTFPKTLAQFQSGMFRWIKYKKGVLRVLVGRGVGHDNREFGGKQVLRTWRHEFTSLHELLCAVEASWVYKNKELTADFVIPEYDTDLGPSKPGPTEPPLLGKAEDAVVVTKCRRRRKLVTALAIVEENGRAVLYSGHADGTLAKWCLEENKTIWCKQVYPDGTRDYPHYSEYNGICVDATGGVAGLVVRPGDGSGHLLYTWSDAHDGYPEVDFENRGPAKVKCWNGMDGAFVRDYACDVGADVEDDPAHPSIATVIFCRLWMSKGKEWVDSMVVGLHCQCNPLDWKGDYSRFDIERAQAVGEGNILPFYEHSNGRTMETWREHSGIIRAMAVVPDKYLLSYSVQFGHGFPDALVLWSLHEPGVPLSRHDFWDPSRSTFKQSLTRLQEVAGLSVSGTEILLASEYGDRIAVVTVENEAGGNALELHGYGNIGNRMAEDGDFHGNMAMSANYAAMSNEAFPEIWLFEIAGLAKHDKLDRREGNVHDFDEQDDDDDEEVRHKYAGRDLAVGKVVMPLFGGSRPKRKKRKAHEVDFVGSAQPEDKFGKGGPVALAMSGKWLVAGFSNGSIARAPFLPDEFAGTESDAGSTGRVSCSRLKRDERHCPTLDCNRVAVGDERGRGNCCIQ